jgi:predicted transcriptional regulator
MLTPPADQRRRRLTITLLQFFTLAHSMTAVSQEAGEFSREEMQEAARGLIAAGFLCRVKGKTRGAVYVLTQEGLAALKALEAMED